MISKIENCSGKITVFYDPDTGSVSNDLIPTDSYDFFLLGAQAKFPVGTPVLYVTVSEPPRGRRIVKNVVRR